jgi:hypothetical protein
LQAGSEEGGAGEGVSFGGMAVGCRHSDGSAAIAETPLAAAEFQAPGKIHGAEGRQRRQFDPDARQFVLQKGAVEAGVMGDHNSPRQPVEHLA